MRDGTLDTVTMHFAHRHTVQGTSKIFCCFLRPPPVLGTLWNSVGKLRRWQAATQSGSCSDSGLVSPRAQLEPSRDPILEPADARADARSAVFKRTVVGVDRGSEPVPKPSPYYAIK